MQPKDKERICTARATSERAHIRMCCLQAGADTEHVRFVLRADTFDTKVPNSNRACAALLPCLTTCCVICAGQFRDGVFNGRGTRIYAGTLHLISRVHASLRGCAARVGVVR